MLVNQIELSILKNWPLTINEVGDGYPTRLDHALVQLGIIFLAGRDVFGCNNLKTGVGDQ